jgi:hypothetical protein
VTLFDAQIEYAMLTKLDGDNRAEEARDSPADCFGTRKQRSSAMATNVTNRVGNVEDVWRNRTRRTRANLREQAAGNGALANTTMLALMAQPMKIHQCYIALGYHLGYQITLKSDL